MGWWPGESVGVATGVDPGAAAGWVGGEWKAWGEVGMNSEVTGWEGQQRGGKRACLS